LGAEPSDRRGSGRICDLCPSGSQQPDWYVGGVNDATARDVDLKLDFLDPGKTYTATIYKDGEGATYLTEARHRIAYETRKVAKGDVIKLWLAPGGGGAIRLTPAK
jgi:alpha-glucosidase